MWMIRVHGVFAACFSANPLRGNLLYEIWAMLVDDV